MDKILGLDLGTNSIGWGIVERDEISGQYTLIDKGVDIFQEGVKIEKGIESSKAAERTEFRSARKRLYRRRLRKIETLRILSENGMCPALTKEQLLLWRYKDKYPATEEFIKWLRTDDNSDKNPYCDRHAALHQKLNPDNISDRYRLGRALYHIAQRRGFLSNRLEATKEKENGKVKESIAALDKAMKEEGCQYLGDYFYLLYGKDRVRNHYTARKEHYKAEFDAICAIQELPKELTIALEKAIFFQRPLRSQKGSVGKCTFEPTKSRCAVSHPRFEEFRMLCFINSIKVQTPYDETPRPLSEQEKELVYPLFTRKSKRQFEFEDIAKKLGGKGNYAYIKDPGDKPYKFNYRMHTSVSGCPVTAGLKDIFGEDWQKEICERYAAVETRNGRKSCEEVINDVWHALVSFSDDDKLVVWAKNRLNLSDEEAESFTKIYLAQDYASLSLGAINKILPFLRNGLLYSHSVFLANMSKVVPQETWNNAVERQNIIDAVASIINDYTPEDGTLVNCIGDFLSSNFELAPGALDKLYHPSANGADDIFADVQPDAKGLYQLGSPRTPSVKNPMAMRALFRLRALINTLLRDGSIDRKTKIHIEFARQLNNANMRKAIEAYQRDREKENSGYRQEIIEQYRQATGNEIEPNDTDILKYRLWIEQDKICPYTGRSIGIAQFIGSSPQFDIEHTIPQSVGGDNSIANKTLCECRFNRDIKKAKIPQQLDNIGDILVRIAGWKEKYEELYAQMDKTRGSFSTKEIKDSMIQKRNKLSLENNYWRDKYGRFLMKEVPEGFRKNQDIDNSIIAKYGRLYLKSVFPSVYTIKGVSTSEFRKIWGLQDTDTRKERTNHVHHCIDAITIACIGRDEYDRLARFYHNREDFENYANSNRPSMLKPWPTFTEDVKAIEQELLVSHHTPDNMHKATRKKMRVRGRIQYTSDGKPKYIQGDSARGSLHQDTYYGAIMRDGQIKYVVRKSLGALKETDVDKIVDEAVREKVAAVVRQKGFKQAMAEPIWMNEERGIAIKKVRCFTPSVTKPIHLKKHRDLSAHEYKQDYHVANDSNYVMALYEGIDGRGKIKRDFELISNKDAAEYYKRSCDRHALPDLVPITKNNLPLKYVIKTGTMVLFYENSPEELYESDHKELSKRLYKVIGMSEQVVSDIYHYGTLSLKYHQEARPSKELNIKGGLYKISEGYRPMIGIKHTQFNALVAGYDFELTVTGKIIFKHN